MGFPRKAWRLVAQHPERQSATLTLHTRCRKCSACLRARAKEWRQRAQDEVTQTWLAGGRVWMVTLTCRMDVHHRHLALTRLRLDQQGIDFGGLPPEEQFREAHAPLGAEVTKYLKLIRRNTPVWDTKFVGPLRPGPEWNGKYSRRYGKPDNWDNTPVRYRYLLVTEIHNGGGEADGLPHLHMLLHEMPGHTLRERRLRIRWQHGHAKAKLVTEVEGAVYPCKYLSKDARARVRASARYGTYGAETADGPEQRSQFIAKRENSPQNLTQANPSPSMGEGSLPPEVGAELLRVWPDLSVGRDVVVRGKRERSTE